MDFHFLVTPSDVIRLVLCLGLLFLFVLTAK